jgi:hypothetical protein
VPQLDFEMPDDTAQIAYWRKHPNLHGWMEALYHRKGETELFNCTQVKLELTDLDELEKAVVCDLLPRTTGFFFGENRPEDKENDLAFILIAREALRSGYNVFYSSWW